MERNDQMIKILFLLFFLILGMHTPADPIPTYRFDNVKQEQQFIKLTDELRCVVCQNQTIASSNTPLASDLRQIIYQKILLGEQNDAIKAFVVDRYGDFVLYQPPFNHVTLLLWLGPIFLLCISIFFASKTILLKGKR